MKIRVDRFRYLTLKTDQLREFGYPKLTVSEVTESIDRVMDEKADPLNVIDVLLSAELPERIGGVE